eukprot:scaffold1466_cov385-Prasinococcus_capsulatus_cf.AAC.22
MRIRGGACELGRVAPVLAVDTTVVEHQDDDWEFIPDHRFDLEGGWHRTPTAAVSRREWHTLHDHGPLTRASDRVRDRIPDRTAHGSPGTRVEVAAWPSNSDELSAEIHGVGSLGYDHRIQSRHTLTCTGVAQTWPASRLLWVSKAPCGPAFRVRLARCQRASRSALSVALSPCAPGVAAPHEHERARNGSDAGVQGLVPAAPAPAGICL